jgi:hypothetical protein
MTDRHFDDLQSARDEARGDLAIGLEPGRLKIQRGCASDRRGSASLGDKLDNAALTRGRP